MTTQTISAYRARTNFGDLLNQVNYGKKTILIKRANKDMAIILPIEIYEALTKVDDKDIEIYSDKRIKEFMDNDKLPK
ncbi:MAG: hypothetical protein CEN91_335 [Candidatus Berkelbacteria bacterium Licking1014_85]|uniref:Antitoxin n=1 Tax=Candidatus Berkelbacteria bacterium Licking1014_85 TaxID=2017148 RepID=A0A554LJ79_9BACT|nr:MAG: hypothetical protein CEN91_335 [Candidatus Berkelbacteria bacterium Licking1014_85]